MLPSEVIGSFSDITYTISASGYYVWDDISVNTDYPYHVVTFTGVFDAESVQDEDVICNQVHAFTIGT